ncbi:MAG: hypothetical protein LUF30_05375 [Lachnospiraceae bacterium]|nr:hypothetical protein [Lachnospiraceae bacterium]
MKEKLKTLFLSDWSPTEKGLLIADVLLLGVLIGWLTSPIKNGLMFFSNNGNTSTEDYSTHGPEDEENDETE